MITIKYYAIGTTGEMVLDIVGFIENHNLTDIKFLCKKVIGISYDKYYISKDIIKICNEKIPEVKDNYEMTNAQKDRLIKKYQRCIELLQGYC